MIDLANYFCINWDNHLTFLLCSVNMGNYINTFSNVKSKLYSWVTSNMGRKYSFKYIARLGWLLFFFGILISMFIGQIGLLSMYWFIFHALCLSHSDLGCNQESASSMLSPSFCKDGLLGRTKWRSFRLGSIAKILNLITCSLWILFNLFND